MDYDNCHAIVRNKLEKSMLINWLAALFIFFFVQYSTVSTFFVIIWRLSIYSLSVTICGKQDTYLHTFLVSTEMVAFALGAFLFSSVI